MNARHPKFTPAVLALIVGIAGSLVWDTAPAQNSPPISTLNVPITGTVGGGTENIALSGRALIMSTLVTDPDFGGPPSVILSIDLLNVLGVGQATGTRFLATGEDNVIRLLRPSDLVEIVFPIFPAGPKGSASARPVVAVFVLTFDVNNGRLRAAEAKFETAGFPG